MTTDALSEEITWNDDGLVPAVAVDADTGAFLMMAWMNRESFDATVKTGQATFFSRSRQRLWKKGESSGNVLYVREIRLDCDGDTVVLVVAPKGPACHTGKPSCAFRVLEGEREGEREREGSHDSPLTLSSDGRSPERVEACPEPRRRGPLRGRAGVGVHPVDGEAHWREDDGPRGAPAAVLDRVAGIAFQRSMSSAEKSYTKSLFDGGWPKILGKLREESGELADELPEGPDAAVIHESADLLFHIIVALTARGIHLKRVWDELERRFGVSGHDEKRSRTQK